MIGPRAGMALAAAPARRRYNAPMADNVVDAVRQAIQDFLAPEVRVIKAELHDLRRETEERFEAAEKIAALHHQALLAAIGQSRAASENTTPREIAARRERVAVLEARR